MLLFATYSSDEIDTGIKEAGIKAWSALYHTSNCGNSRWNCDWKHLHIEFYMKIYMCGCFIFIHFYCSFRMVCDYCTTLLWMYGIDFVWVNKGKYGYLFFLMLILILKHDSFPYQYTQTDTHTHGNCKHKPFWLEQFHLRICNQF